MSKSEFEDALAQVSSFVDPRVLESLPYAATVALSARCARRVPPLFVSPKEDATRFIKNLVDGVEWGASNPRWGGGEVIGSYYEDAWFYVDDGASDLANKAGLAILAAVDAAWDLADRQSPAKSAAVCIMRAASVSDGAGHGDSYRRSLSEDTRLLMKAFDGGQITSESAVPPQFFAVFVDSSSTILQVVRDFSNELAWLVARDKRNLNEIEWRDLERMLAKVFEHLGFEVVLTPGSKDGGRDLILSCEVAGLPKSYVVEVKHWRSGKRVGRIHVEQFIRVVAREKREGGLFLATYGYTPGAVEAITEIDHHQISLGDKDKIVSLCRTYTRSEYGVWQRTQALPEMLFFEDGLAR